MRPAKRKARGRFCLWGGFAENRENQRFRKSLEKKVSRHSERSEESLFLLESKPGGIPHFVRNDDGLVLMKNR